MKSLFEQNDGTYRKQGDYLIPYLTLLESDENSIGVYGQRHLNYLQEHRKLTYINLLTSGKLNAYLADIDNQAQERFELLVNTQTKTVFRTRNSLLMTVIQVSVLQDQRLWNL